MSMTRINEFRAKEGQAGALRSFLARLVPTIAGLPGCLSSRLLQSHDEPVRFIVLESWESIEAHQAAVKDISPESVAERLKSSLSIRSMPSSPMTTANTGGVWSNGA